MERISRGASVKPLAPSSSSSGVGSAYGVVMPPGSSRPGRRRLRPKVAGMSESLKTTSGSGWCLSRGAFPQSSVSFSPLYL